MKIRSLFLAGPALAAGLACSTPSSAERTARTEPQDRPTEVGSAGTGMASGDLKGHASDQVIMGRIADASESSIVIESTSGDRHTLSLVDQTVVTISGRDSSASSLQPGQDVRASFNEVEGRNVAVRVEATPLPGSDTYTPASPPGTSPTESAPGTATPPMHPGSTGEPVRTEPSPTGRTGG